MVITCAFFAFLFLLRGGVVVVVLCCRDTGDVVSSSSLSDGGGDLKGLLCMLIKASIDRASASALNGPLIAQYQKGEEVGREKENG
jgi:hypothetical protein